MCFNEIEHEVSINDIFEQKITFFPLFCNPHPQTNFIIQRDKCFLKVLDEYKRVNKTPIKAFIANVPKNKCQKKQNTYKTYKHIFKIKRW